MSKKKISFTYILTILEGSSTFFQKYKSTSVLDYCFTSVEYMEIKIFIWTRTKFELVSIS